MFATDTGDVAGLTQLLDDLLQKLHRQVLGLGQFRHAHELPPHLGSDAKVDQGAEGVFAAFREFHKARFVIYINSVGISSSSISALCHTFRMGQSPTPKEEL